MESHQCLKIADLWRSVTFMWISKPSSCHIFVHIFYLFHFYELSSIRTDSSQESLFWEVDPRESPSPTIYILNPFKFGVKRYLSYAFS